MNERAAQPRQNRTTHHGKCLRLALRVPAHFTGRPAPRAREGFRAGHGGPGVRSAATPLRPSAHQERGQRAGHGGPWVREARPACHQEVARDAARTKAAPCGATTPATRPRPLFIGRTAGDGRLDRGAAGRPCPSASRTRRAARGPGTAGPTESDSAGTTASGFRPTAPRVDALRQCPGLHVPRPPPVGTGRRAHTRPPVAPRPTIWAVPGDGRHGTSAQYAARACVPVVSAAWTGPVRLRPGRAARFRPAAAAGRRCRSGAGPVPTPACRARRGRVRRW